MNRLKRKEADRPRCFWGALISAGLGIAGALLNSNAQKKQRRLQANLEDYNNSLEEAQGMTNALNAGQDYQQNYLQQFKQQARLGTTRRLGSRNIMITDGGNAKRIGNNTYLLRGGSHEDINETGQTGIGINIGGNEIEAEGGEVAQRKGNSLRIYSAQPILGGISPAQAIMRGYNKDKVFNAQQRFKKNNGIKDDGSKAKIGGYYGANYPSPLSLLSILYDKTLGQFDDKNPNLQIGIPPTASRGLNLKQVRSGLVNRNMLPTNRVYRIANMREVKDAKAIGQYRKLPEGVTLPTKTVRTRSGRTFEFGKAGGNSHGGKAAAMGEPWTGTTSSGYNESKYVISTPSRHTVWQVGHHGNYSKPLPADAIKKGSGLWKKFDDEGNTGISTKRMVVYKDLGNGRYLRIAKSKYRLGGGLTSKDRGSSKHPYPSVSSKDFAGGGRSYPIPTKADAVDALRLAGLHGRSDVRSKVYSKYPELRKKAEIGTNISLDSSYGNKDFLHRITQGHPTARKIINEIFGDEADRRRFMQDLNIFGLTSDDASGIAGASPIFRQPIVSAARQAQFIQNANKARQAANANKARQAANYAQQQVDYIKELSDRMSATIRNVGEQLGIRVNPNPNNSVRRLYSSNFKPANTNNRITTPRETPINSSNSFTETPINSTTTSATNTPTYSGKTTKFNTKYRSYRNAGFSPRTSKNLVKANKLGLYSTIGGFGTIGAGTLIGSNIDKTNKGDKANKAQLDSKGKPISRYIARPQEPVKHLTGQVPDSIARKDTTRTNTTRTDTTRTNTTKQVNKVVKRQVRTTPQYKGNTTKGNYQLHDGETKIINGVKYTRRGNTIINHKTNVGYIYDKNGNYTGQADYSKVGNFNQAFDAARAAGRSQFIYRAGKYNNYSTVKETNAKKEALNRRIGASRIAKRMGCLTNPPVGSRKKYLPGGTANPWDKYRFTDYTTPNTWNEKYGISNVPDYGGVSPWQISNKYDVNVPYSISKYDLPITTITAKKNTFNDEMSKRMRAGVQNLKDDSDSKTTVPYLGKQSSFKPTTQDYIGLGIDTLASLGIGLINSSAASKTYLPERTAIIQASKLPTYYNVSPQVEEIKRQRDILNGEISNNTSSSVAALNRISRIRGAATGEINKLYATKENEENKMLTQDALNQQQVAAENAKLQADYETNKANILNAASQAKANALSGTLSGLSQAWTNFASSIENRYNNRQNEAIIAATAKDPAVLSNAIQFGYNFSPEILAGVYNSTKDENLKDLVLSQLNNKNRRKYGIK